MSFAALLSEATASNNLPRTDDRGGKVSVRTLIQRLAAHRAAGVVAAPLVPIGVDAAAWLAARPALDRVLASRPSTETSSALGAIPSLRCRQPALSDSGHDPVLAARTSGDALGAALSRLDAVTLAATGDAAFLEGVTVAQLLAISSGLPLLATVAKHAGGSVFAASSAVDIELRNNIRTTDSLAAAAQAAAAVAARWAAAIDARDTRAALAVASDKEGSPFKFFSGRWRDVKALVERSYRFSDHQVRPSIVSVLTDLAAMHDANEASASSSLAAEVRFGTNDLEGLVEAIDRLRENPLIDVLQAGSFEALPAACAATVTAIQSVIVSSGVSVAALGQLASALQITPVSHERMLLAWAGLWDVPPGVLDAALDPVSSPDQVELAVLIEALQRAATIDGGRYAGERLDDVADQLLERHRHLLAANAGMVGARARFWSASSRRRCGTARFASSPAVTAGWWSAI